ncbi:alpha/beta hydrolase [Planomonospora sp. ID67723]|uniref:alpha/beta hydrolase family protein n=1 Tax=Planomonospora sp. ID67723 TaxID=2738134 RepID=UPI0018C3D0AF|nr:alpha/beta hydrolase [Planomonospora sp. ID67723]MBG0833119.1 alpha/beta hydrolase [Planomonospora sp. ID67723]
MPTSVLRSALAAAVVLLTFTAPAAAAAERVPALVLSEPTGPHPVGTTSLHLVDESRPDPWVAEKTVRELMVSLWYPSRTAQGRRAPYMTAREAQLLLENLKEQHIEGLPADALSGARTNAFTDAPALGHNRRLPLVVLSPGFGAPRSSLTTLAEDLASRGYVVAGIDHTYESAGTTFPDGHTTTCVACRSLDSPGFGKKATKGRAADVSFVLDRLLGPDPAWKGARLIDPSRIAMAGHSLGGASSAWTMLTDARVRAGINLDGGLHIPLPDRGLSRPFLMMGANSHKPGGRDATWGRDWPRMTGWKRWLTVEGMDHLSFSDFPLLADRISPGPIPGPRAVEITRNYVGAFVDLHLRQRPQPLLERPSRRYPEVKFWK